MKKISDLFTDEEKKQLGYLGSMLHQEPTEEEEEAQRMWDVLDRRAEGCRLVLRVRITREDCVSIPTVKLVEMVE